MKIKGVPQTESSLSYFTKIRVVLINGFVNKEIK